MSILVLLGHSAWSQDAPLAEEESSAPQAEASAEPEAEGEVAPELEAATEVEPELDPEIEEIIVTGEKSANEFQDVPVSATSFDQQELKSLRIQNIQDVADYTPNLEINTAFAASNPTIFIRGIGLKDYNANAAGAVAVYQDGININSPAVQLGQLFDVRSIDVLRGPQGSLNGRNATAGAIMINSNLPDGEFGASGSFTYGNYNLIEVEGALNFPIADVLSTRVAFTANFRDGITKNQCADWDPEANGFQRVDQDSTVQAWVDAGQPTRPRFFRLQADQVCVLGAPTLDTRSSTPQDPVFLPLNPEASTLETFQGLKHYTNNVENWAGRGIMKYDPMDTMEWILNVHGGQNRSDSFHLQMLGANSPSVQGAPFQGALASNFSEANAAFATGIEDLVTVDGLVGGVPLGRGADDPFSGWYDKDGTEFLDAMGGSLRGDWDLDSVSLLSLTGLEWYERLVEDEADASPASVFPADWFDTAWQVTQELRAEGDHGRFGWSLGGFLLYEELDADNVFPSTRQLRLNQIFDQKLLSFAPYVSGRVDFTDALTLDGGLRFNVESKEFTLSSTAIGTSSNTPFQEIPEETETATWTGLTGNARLAYAPTWAFLDAARVDYANVYGQYSRGMKGGHFNAGLSVQNSVAAQSIEPVDPEFIHAVEVGLKSRWFDDRLLVNGAVFRYWYQDLQVFDIVNEVGSLPTQQLLNSDANVLGAEVELETRPFGGLFIQAAFGWIDSEFVDFNVTKATSLGPRGEPIEEEFDYSGNPLIAAPRYNLSGIVEYDIPFFGMGSLIPHYDFSWRSKVYLDPQAIDPISQPAYWVHNARLAYRTENERIEVAAWVRNFTNEFYVADVFDVSREFNTILQAWSDPRTFGVTVSFAW